MKKSCLLLLAPLMTTVPIQADVEWQKHVIDKTFRAEACIAADINGDGQLDIVAGENWYEAPAWTPHKFRTVAIQGGYADVRCDGALDVNHDGRADIVTVHRGSLLEWLENPGRSDAAWPRHKIGHSPLTEAVVFADINADNRNDILGPFGKEGQAVAAWLAPPKDNLTWKRIDIGPQGGRDHGIGAGDINRDGRVDILTQIGWYAAPRDPTSTDWTFNPMDRGQTHNPIVYDFDGDGDQDIAAASPHDYGLYWWQQFANKAEIKWQRHTIDNSISQLHGLIANDLDGDGDMDLITGKRYKAHNGRDPGTDEPAMLVWYELKRDGQQATFIRHDIDDDSGVGYVVSSADIDNDGDIDILTSNKKGVFLFEQTGKRATTRTAGGT